MGVLWTLLGVLLVAALSGVAIFNGLVRKNNLVKEGWSGVEAQLKRRADLIPNLVQTVKGYAAHERATLDAVTALRARSMEGGSVQERANTERALSAALGGLIAVAESYPDLKASTNFLSLQTDLATVEDDIQLARRYYNATVRDLNILVQSFPSSLIAAPFGFKIGTFFEAAETDRQTPNVSLSQPA